jgi:hypothetical protein
MPFGENIKQQLLTTIGLEEEPSDQDTVSTTPMTDQAAGVTPAPRESLSLRASALQALDQGSPFGGAAVTGGLDPSGISTDMGQALPPELESRIRRDESAKERREKRIQRSMARPGIPLDRFRGVQDLGFRARLNMLQDPKAKLNYLTNWMENQGVSPVENPPRYVDGNFIVSQKDPETGGIKDVVVDEPGFSTADIADLVNEAIPLMMGLAGERKILPKLMTGVKGRLLKGGAGVGAGRFGQTTIAREALGVERDPLTDVKSAAIEAGADVAGGLALSKIVNIANFAMAPNRKMSRTQEYQKFQESMQRLESELGIPITATPGQLLGSENLLVLENFASTQYGGEVLRQVRDDALKLRALVGKELTNYPNKGNVNLANLDPGSDILKKMWDDISTTYQAFSKASDDVIYAAVNDFTNTAAKETTSQTLGKADIVGRAVRNVLEASRTSFRNINEANYSESDRLLREAYTQLGEEAPADTLVTFKGAESILNQVAKRAQLKKGELRSILPEFYDSWRKEFDLIKENGGASIEQANDLRIALADAIDSMGGFGQKPLSTKDANLLTKLRDSVTKSMDDAYDKLPDGSAKEAFLKANKYYRDNVVRFQTPTIKKLFDTTPEGQIRMGDEDILAAISRNSSAYKELRQFITDDTTWNNVRRGILDDVLMQASSHGTPDLGDVYRSLKNMPPLIRKDLLGDSQAKVLSQLKQLTGLDLDLPSRKIPYEVVMDWMQKPSSKTKAALIKANNAQTTLDTQFKSDLKNQVISKFQDPKLLSTREDNVSKIIDLATNEEAKWAASAIGSGVKRDKLTQQTIEELFRRSNMEGKLNLVKVGIDFPTKNFINSSSLRDQLLGKKKEVYKALLGDEAHQLMMDYLTFLSRGDVSKEKAGAAVGTLSRGSFINNIVRKAATNTYNYAKWKVVSGLLASPPLRKWVLGRGFERLEAENMLPAMLVGGSIGADFAEYFSEEGDDLAYSLYDTAVESLAPNALVVPPDLVEPVEPQPQPQPEPEPAPEPVQQ